MYTIVSLLILFLIVIFSILLYFKSKKSRQSDLENGICPRCEATAREFIDESTDVKFKTEVINFRVLKNHGCSGISEIEYRCNSCDLKEIHTVLS